MKRVTGIGGIFFKTKDPNATKAWYAKHLGFDVDEYGATFITKKPDNPTENQYLSWSPFNQNTDYFSPSEKDFMINYRVENLENLVTILKSEGVTICDEISYYEYGKFVHIMDVDGNKIELWEPIDHVFDQYYKNKKIVE
ncbi:MAG: VOC family protein [Saprospiraceae bacterium]|jgi:predicted enzyme related to lactoylglutathione lyase